MAAAGDGVHVSSKRLAPSKRRMSRDVVLPDVTNLPEVHQDVKVTRRHPLLERTTSLSSASDLQVGTNGHAFAVNQGGVMLPPGRHGHKMSGTGENQGQLVRAAKIAAKAKIKAINTPYRKKKQVFKVPAVPDPIPPSFEEPMEIDNPALTFPAFEERVPESVLDIDDHDDYFLAPEYAQDIFSYMQSREKMMQLSPDYLAMNPEVTSQMRGILMDWLIQVQAHEQLEEETLQLCVTITDQFLARAAVPLSQLQLLGITCLLLAAKFVERFPPLVGTLCALTAGTYSDLEVLEMEKQVLCVLQFQLSRPLPNFFLQRLLLVHSHDVQVERLAVYLIDLSLPSIHFVPVLPSALAASALYVSRRVWLPEEPATWTPALTFYSGHRFSDLVPTVRLLANILLRAPVSKYQGARQKHSDEVSYGAISVDPVLDNHPALIQLARLNP